MAKSHKKKHASRKTRKNMYRSVKKALPAVKQGLTTVGKTAVKVAEKSRPIIEKSVGKIYGVLAEGFDMGLRGIKKTASKMRKTRKHRKH
jgi:hypothetical protein